MSLKMEMSLVIVFQNEQRWNLKFRLGSRMNLKPGSKPSLEGHTLATRH